MTKRVFEKPINDKEEIIRHFDIVAEDLKGTITQIAEGVSINSELLEQLTKRVDAVEEQLVSLLKMMFQEYAHISVLFGKILRRGQLTRTSRL